MEYKDDKLGTRFVLPDRPTVRQVLAYDSAWELARDVSTYERLWLAACAVAQEWESPHVKLERLPDELTTEGYAVVKWAGLVCFGYMQELKEVPKNS